MKRKAIIYQIDCMPVSCPFVVDIYIWNQQENKFVWHWFKKYFDHEKQALLFANKYADIVKKEGFKQ